MEEKRYAPCPECGGLNGGHSSYKCPKMTLEEAQNKIIEVEQRWIKVNSRMAAGNQKSFSRLKTAIIFYQGKYTLLKVENNKLRQNASKLHQANEVIKVLEYDNNKLKGQVEGLTSAVEELKGTGARWVKASDFKHEVGMPYHAKDSASKGAGHFNSNGAFIWGDCTVTYPKDQDDLYILDESAAGREDAVEFAEWAATIAFFDDGSRLWELIGEGEAINGQFRFTTKEFYEIFKQQKEK